MRVVRAVVLFACLLTPLRADAALAVVQRTDSGGEQVGNTVCTNPFPSPVTAGNLIVSVYEANNAATLGSDNLANTYVATTHTDFNGGTTGRHFGIFYAKNIAGGTDSVCVTQGSVFTAVAAYEISGADTSAPYVMDSTGDGTGTTIQTGTLTLGGVSSIIIGVFQSYPQVPTPFTGYTLSTLNSSSDEYDEYHITSTDEAAGATIASSAGYDIIAAAFKAGSAAPASHCNPAILLLRVGCGD